MIYLLIVLIAIVVCIPLFWWMEHGGKPLGEDETL